MGGVNNKMADTTICNETLLFYYTKRLAPLFTLYYNFLC